MPEINAEVVGVFPSKVRISVDNISDFKVVEEELKIGSYLRIIGDNENVILIAMINSFSIEATIEGGRKHFIEASPLGIITDGIFIRGGDSIAIPPKKVEPAKKTEIQEIFGNSVPDAKKYIFSTLNANRSISVPVDGDKFFNKHIAIVGSTGSGKSHTVAKLIQKARDAKNSGYSGLNNSHIVIFDIHSEYKSAFPEANVLSIDNLIIPYWLLNSDELEQILLDTGERDNYNQASVFRSLVTENKRLKNPTVDKVFYDSPLFFDIQEVLNALTNIKNETVNAKNTDRYMIVDPSYKLEAEGKTNVDSGILLTNDEKMSKYFEKVLSFHPRKSQSITSGDYSDGTLDKFVSRFQAKVSQDRLEFLFGEHAKSISFLDTVKQFIGYEEKKEKNAIIIDLSGVPFEVLSITVSLISRVIFEYGYHYKRFRTRKDPSEKINNDTPILVVYEEAHKYAPRSDLAKYRPSLLAIERIAKEGRKYGISLLLASQRPSEISETIFSQCNNFIAMRLTNPDDQSFVKKLLPDTMESLIDQLPVLRAGEALLIGEAVVIPSIVKIETCDIPPSSNDIPYWQLWKGSWKESILETIEKEWMK